LVSKEAFNPTSDSAHTVKTLTLNNGESPGNSVVRTVTDI